MAEVRHLFYRPFDEFKHVIVVLVDSKLNLIFDLWLHLSDLLVVLLR